VRLKKRNSAVFLLFFLAVIPIFSGVITARAAEKTVLKIQKDKKEITEPSKQPSDEEKVDLTTIEGSEKKDMEKGEGYTYDPTNKVDPFKSFIVAKKELEENKKGEPKTYLETLDISQLTLSAIVLSDKENWALVRDSRGEGHVIKAGTSIGNRGGRVTKILEKEVVVREYYSDIRGREVVRDISIKLPLAD